MIEFKRRTNRKILGLTPNSALVIEAIRATGKEYISERVRKKNPGNSQSQILEN